MIFLLVWKLREDEWVFVYFFICLVLLVDVIILNYIF